MPGLCPESFRDPKSEIFDFDKLNCKSMLSCRTLKVRHPGVEDFIP